MYDVSGSVPRKTFSSLCVSAGSRFAELEAPGPEIADFEGLLEDSVLSTTQPLRAVQSLTDLSLDRVQISAISVGCG